MATGTVGKLFEYGDPPVVTIGTVVSPGWAANITATVNGIGFAQIARSVILPASSCAQYYTGAAALGGWTDAGIGAVAAAASTNYLLFPIELPFASTATGSSPVLTGATIRVKPNSTGTMTARIYGANRQNTTSAPLLVNVSASVSSDGTSNEQILTLTATSPPTIDATTSYWIQVTAGNTSDKVDSATVNYTIAGY